MIAILLIAALTMLSGIGDAQGFVHAARVWQNGQFVWAEALKSAAGFQMGVLFYWFMLRYLIQLGVAVVEIQTLFWFAATMVGVGIFSGRILRWPPMDQAVACIVLVGIAWLLIRTAR